MPINQVLIQSKIDRSIDAVALRCGSVHLCGIKPQQKAATLTVCVVRVVIDSAAGVSTANALDSQCLQPGGGFFLFEVRL